MSPRARPPFLPSLLPLLLARSQRRCGRRWAAPTPSGGARPDHRRLEGSCFFHARSPPPAPSGRLPGGLRSSRRGGRFSLSCGSARVWMAPCPPRFALTWGPGMRPPRTATGLAGLLCSPPGSRPRPSDSCTPLRRAHIPTPPSSLRARDRPTTLTGPFWRFLAVTCVHARLRLAYKDG